MYLCQIYVLASLFFYYFLLHYLYINNYYLSHFNTLAVLQLLSILLSLC